MISRLFLTLLLFCGISHATASEVTSYLQEKAQDFVLGQLDVPLDAQVQVQAASIDERLPLSRCDEHLAITLPAKMEIRRNTTVYLKCEEEKPWDLYLPVRVSIQKPYVTVSTPVAKGDILSEGVLTQAYQDQTLMRGDYLSDTTALIGVRTRPTTCASGYWPTSSARVPSSSSPSRIGWPMSSRSRARPPVSPSINIW